MAEPYSTNPIAVRRPTTDVKITTVRGESISSRPDVLATEEPMEIRIHGPNQEPVAITVTMRTPGHDFELAVGLLYNEGIIDSYDGLHTVCYCTNVSKQEQRYNVVTVELSRPYLGIPKERTFISSSACGVCGTTSIDNLAARVTPVQSSLNISIATMLSVPKQLSKGQRLFKQTGGIHGAAIFDSQGRLELVREDIGRHNAVDKIVGHYFLKQRLPMSDKILALSGRIGFELVQKAAMAKIPIVIAVSAPSSLAVNTAEAQGITLVGFTRDENANIYTHPERISLDREVSSS